MHTYYQQSYPLIMRTTNQPFGQKSLQEIWKG